MDGMIERADGSHRLRLGQVRLGYLTMIGEVISLTVIDAD